FGSQKEAKSNFAAQRVKGDCSTYYNLSPKLKKLPFPPCKIRFFMVKYLCTYCSEPTAAAESCTL
ncbi:MAG: hypothetical protein ACI4RK_10855, partial [Oscillospiraceae bacterium]